MTSLPGYMIKNLLRHVRFIFAVMRGVFYYRLFECSMAFRSDSESFALSDKND